MTTTTNLKMFTTKAIFFGVNNYLNCKEQN